MDFLIILSLNQYFIFFVYFYFKTLLKYKLIYMNIKDLEFKIKLSVLESKSLKYIIL